MHGYIATNDLGGAGCVGDPHLVEYVYRATDDCGNSAECTQRVTIADTTAPLIESCAADAAVECLDEVPAPSPGTVVASDNCDDLVEVTVVYSRA